MAPEIRWAVLRSAVETKAVPGSCLGLLAYLFIVEPREIKSEELAEILHRNEKTIRGQLRQLELAGFIALKLSRHGKALELLAPSMGVKGVHTVKAGQNDTSFSPVPDMHKVGKIDRPGASRSVKETDLDVEVGKIAPPGNGQVGKIDPPGIQVGKIDRPEVGEFLKGMLDALENRSKPEKTDPVCPDNNETKPS
jgi:hypothetical protein